MPGTAVMPPSSHCMSVMRALGIYGRSLEARPLVPPHHDVEVLDAVGRAALAQVVERGDAYRATRARIGHHGDVAEVGADHRAGGRALTLGNHAHEGLAGVELAIEAGELAGADAPGQRHGRGREQP